RPLGAGAGGLAPLPSKPLPPRLEVTRAPTLDAADLKALVEMLDRLPGVTEVQAALGWVEPLERLRRGLRLGGVTLAGALALGALGAAAGATMAARRAGATEASILRLAGLPRARLSGPVLPPAVAPTPLGALL